MRHYGIGGGSDAANVLDGFRTETDRRSAKDAISEDARRKKAFDTEQHRGIRMDDTRAENHAQSVATERELRPKNTHIQKARQPATSAQGIRTADARASEQSQTGGADTESRLRGVRKETAAKEANARSVQSKVADYKAKADSGRLSKADEKKYTDLAIEEQRNMYDISQTDPALAARLINDSAIMNVNDAHDVRVDPDGYWRVYNEQGSVSVNEQTGEPVEFKAEEIENALNSTSSSEPKIGKAQESENDDTAEIQKRLSSNPEFVDGDLDVSEVRALAEQAGMTPIEWLDEIENESGGGDDTDEIQRRLSSNREFVENDLDIGEVRALAEQAGLTPLQWLDQIEGR